jgi:hypothetical protein
VPTIAANKGTKRGIRSNKRGPKWQPQQVVVTTICDEGNNDKNAGDSDEEVITTAERDFKCKSWQPADHFKKHLEATCPNHTYPIWHKLKECTMVKNYMTMGTFAGSKKLEGDSAGKAVAPFPEEKAVMSIYGGPAPHESCRKLKLTNQTINAVSAYIGSNS